MKKTYLFSMLLSSCLLLFNTGIAHATTNTDIDFNNRLVDGRNIAYMIHPGNEYTSSIPNAAYKLQYPSGLSNNLVLNQTNDYMTSKMDLYQYNTIDGRNAMTSVFRKNSTGTYYNCTSQMNSYDWVYGEIRINDYYMSTLSANSKATCEAVIIHEMLHVYGLNDISNSSSIMYYKTPNVTSVTSDANAVLNNKY